MTSLWNMMQSAAVVIVLVVGSIDIVSGLKVPGPFQPSRNNILGYVAVGDNMHVELDIVVHSFPSGWANVFRIGHDNYHRYPGMFLHPKSGTPGNAKAGFYVSVADGAFGCSNVEFCGSLGGALVTEQSYHVEIDFDQSTIKVTIDDTLVYNDTVIQHTLYDSAELYISDDDYVAADVTISNFAVSETFTSPTTPAPTTPTPTTPAPTTPAPTITECGCEDEINSLNSSLSSAVTLLQIKVAELDNILTNGRLGWVLNSAANAHDGDVDEGSVMMDGMEQVIWTEKDLAIVVLAAINLVMVIAMVIACKRSGGNSKYQPVAVGSDVEPINA